MPPILTYRVFLSWLLVYALAYPLVALAQSAPPATPPSSLDTLHQVNETQQNTAALEPQAIGELTKLQDRTAKLEQDIGKYKAWIEWAIWLGGAVIVIAGFFGWQSIRDAVRKAIQQNLDTQLKAELAVALPDKLANVQTKAESYLLRFAQLLALHGLNHFDEALVAYGWDGSVSNLRKESPTIRRVIIECLHGSRIDRKLNRQTAWEALNELLNDDSSIETKRLFLRISYASRRIHEGVTFVDKVLDDIKHDREAALRASTILRKVNRQEDALALVQEIYDPNDLECVVHSAVLQRDLGNFDGAHDVLTPAVTALISDPKTRLPEGWHRLLNTYVANCLDRRRPEDGIRPAEFVFRSSPGAVEVFTVGRLIRALPKTNTSREELRDRFNAAIEGLAPGEAKLRCEVLQKQMSEKYVEAEQLLRDSIDAASRVGRGEMDSDTYFQHCTLGEFYIERKRPDDAIDILMPAANVRFGGEAKFNLAIAYAMKGENRDSARWLTQALEELPKWAAQARDHNVLRANPDVANVLANYARGHQGSN